MPWTDEQCNQIFEQYWQSSSGRCPLDNSILNVDRRNHMGGYFLFASCPRCGASMQRAQDRDPRVATFRAWTAEEKSELLDQYFQTHYCTCPVCDTSVDVKPINMIDGRIIVLDCPRCRNSSQEQVPRTH